ncbi:hypothetical protein HDA40_007518 [Hamadaea flava]|uniref:WD40 repeat protein n=1 Tax=Hamadaea flava TaxID=1742688 RepID=A0ABV8M0V3_9ACTN|nr:hypothetical protein [Hamadaea flava]MCP2329011.1 hypothetical protein [Hamadaea flava]
MRAKLLLTAAAFALLIAVTAGVIRHARHPAVYGSAPLTLHSGLYAVSTAPATQGHLISGGEVAALTCSRFYAAAGTGICLRPDGPLATYQVVQVDAQLREKDKFPLVGVPNRARVSPSGRLLAWTVFVAGDSYNNGKFSTRAGILDTVSGDLVGTLEDFTVTPPAAADRNFWGVTFTADDDHFYATMSTRNHRYLVYGSVSQQAVAVVRDGVECPSLSPDGTRIAYKSAVAGDPARGWRLSVLTLSTGRVVPLAETRSVDDQAIWLSADSLGYALRRPGGADVWSVPADGTGTPSLLLADAESPVMLAP